MAPLGMVASEVSLNSPAESGVIETLHVDLRSHNL
jgi:hypothetical protein